MYNFITAFLGTSPLTSALGYAIVIVVAIRPYLTNPVHQKIADILIVVLGAVYARATKDSNGVKASEGKAMKTALVKAEVIKPEPVAEPKQGVEINEERVDEIKAAVVPENVKKKTTTTRKRTTKVGKS